MQKDDIGMWLARLDLLAFGRFTDVRLKLGRGLQLVYGPNEAGKSTTLRAIRQLLFGFDERTSDNFVHQNPNLRIGGIVCDGSDREWEVIRRKARKDSLRAPDETTTIDENQWQQLLCGIDEQTFSNRYGIDYGQLVHGGHEIATGTGDLGEILFATGSGVMDLTSVQKRLVEEASELFKPQGKKQRLNQAIYELQEQRKLVNDNLLPVAEWEEVDRLRQQTQSQLDKVAQQWTAKSSEAKLHQRWLEAAPLIQELDTLEQQLLSLGTTIRLPPEFGKSRQEARLLLEHADSQERAQEKSLTQIQEQLERFEIPDEMPGRIDELTRILTEWGSYSKAQLDRGRLVTQAKQFQDKIAEMLRGMGRSSTDMRAHGIAIDREQRLRISQLGSRQASLSQAVHQAEIRRDRTSSQLKHVQSELAAIPATAAKEELQDVVRQTRMDGDLESRLAKTQTEIATLQDDARVLQEQLTPWPGSLAKLRRMPIPKAESVDQRESTFDKLHTERAILQARFTELDVEHQHLVRQVQELRQQFQVPTEQDLQLARETRDKSWAEIRAVIAAKKVPSAACLQSFEREANEADHIADRLRSESDRVAQLADQSAELETIEAKKADVAIRLAKLDTERTALEELWKSDWPQLVMPLTPGEMRTWIARREILLQNDAQISRRTTEAKELVEKIKQRSMSLSLLLNGSATTSSDLALRKAKQRKTGNQEPVVQLDSSAARQQLSFGWEPDGNDETSGDANSEAELSVPGTQSLDALLSRAETELERDEAARQARKEADQTIARLNVEKSDSDEQWQRAKKEWQKWQTDWQAAMTELDLSLDSSHESVATYFESIGELLDHQRQVDLLAERIQGIDLDGDRFKTTVKQLCEKLAPDLVESPIDQAMKSLRDRLSATQKDQATFNELAARRKSAEEQWSLATKSRTRGQQLIVDLCAAANIRADENDRSATSSADSLERIFQQLADIEDKAKKQRLAEEKRGRVRQRLLDLAGDASIESFLEQVRSLSPAALTSRLQELEAESKQLAVERDRLNHQLGGCDEKLRQMDGSAVAAEAEEAGRQCLAQIRSDAEQYIRLKLASSVLHTAIERYRETIRGPVLRIAGDLFRELTLDSFAGLQVAEDDHGTPILVGVRTGGREAVTVDGMSEGTCDQLYLALRLASLEVESAPRNQLPFIVDDILIQFDDARSAAALRVLSRVAKQRQVIFFTHHEHLLEVANKYLPGEYQPHRLDI